MDPREMTSLVRASRAQTVLVSGNCYGGQFAGVGACGFFAARPDAVAQGCGEDSGQLSEDHPMTDYTSRFFEGAEALRADVNHDGRVSFEEAHWYATTHGSNSDSTYTTFDSLADEYFERHPQDLPQSMSRGDILELGANAANQAERRAFGELINRTYFSEYPYPDGPAYRTNFEHLFLRWTEFPIQTPFGQMRAFISPRNMLGQRSPIRLQIPTSVSTAALEAVRPRLPMGTILESNHLDRNRDGSYSAFINVLLPETPERSGSSRRRSILLTRLEDPGFHNYLQFYSRDHYSPALVQLVRRLLFRNILAQRPALMTPRIRQVLTCESQSIRDFLGARRGPNSPPRLPDPAPEPALLNRPPLDSAGMQAN